MAGDVAPPDPALGVFDTLLVRAGTPVDLGAHVARLARSVTELYDVPVDASALAARITTEVEAFELARVRTSYDPGSGQWDVDALAIDVPGLEPRTLVLRRRPGGLGPHKWTDRRPIAEPAGADDVLLVDEHDRLLECGSANVVVVLGDTCVTPPLDGRILPGTVRARALARLVADDRAVVERPVSVTELGAADEVFTTSSIRGVQPVIGCLEVGSWPVGAVSTWLRRHLAEPLG